MKLKLGTILVAIILIVGELNCQPISDNDDNLLINKNRDITLPNNNNNNNNTNNSDNSNSSSSSNSSESNDSELINNNSGNNNNNKTEVPLIFPDDTKNYKILPSNVTIIKKLLHQNGDSSEIDDLNKAPTTEETIPPIKNAADENKTLPKKVIDEPPLLTGRNLKLKTTSSSIKPTLKNGDYYEDDYSSGEEVYNDDTENVQEKNTKKPETELEEQYERHSDIKAEQQLPVDIQDIDNPVQEKTTDTSPSNSVLFIVIVVTVAFICTAIYLSLFIWRRKLEGRYGMRERLVTNEDDVFQDDVHYRNQQQFGPSITVREIC